jgi:hypothetical protein
MAAAAGDGGRDSQLFQADGHPGVAFQYSVSGQWKPKINETKKRLLEQFSQIRELIYLTSQVIGPKADSLRREFSREGIQLDIRDATWFLDRANLDANRANAAEQLAKAMVDPLLTQKGLTGNGAEFTHDEARIALFYLEMQREDEERGKNLTRSSFEALVKAALKGSDRDNRIKLEEIYRRVGVFLPRHDSSQLKPFIDRALSRLKRGAITEWAGSTEYHLAFEESEKLKDKAAKLLLMQSALEADIQEILSISPSTTISDISLFTRYIQKVIEQYLLRRGDEFAKAVSKDSDINLNDYELRQAISTLPPEGLVGGRNASEFVRSTVITLLNTPSDSTRDYLRILSDSYTLFAFLSETPDVQKTTNKLFSNGELWVDTSVLLPVIAETSAQPDARPFTALFHQLRKASTRVCATPGVIEEVRSHLVNSRLRSQTPNWVGANPYVYSRYIINGRSPLGFGPWSEDFMGDYDPLRDLADYFSGLGISVEQPDEADAVSDDVKNAVLAYWQEVQSTRRRDRDIYTVMTDRLARHDAENCLTVIAARNKGSRRRGLGHTSWWLTLDRAAYKMKSKIDPEVWNIIGFSPVISLDYLMKYLAFGPARDKIKTSESSTSRIFAEAIMDSVPSEILEIAAQIRAQNDGLAENIIQRRIRDALDRERERIGGLHRGGAEDFDLSLIM